MAVKVTSPDRQKVLRQYIGSTQQQNARPGDCSSPTQVQDQQSSVQNQQDPTKDLADKIRTLLEQNADVTPPGRLKVL